MESQQQSLKKLICDKRIKSIISTDSNALVASNHFLSNRRAIVQASLSTVFDKNGRHLSGTLCLTGDTMEGIIQLLVFLKAFSVSLFLELTLAVNKLRCKYLLERKFYAYKMKLEQK
jgi:hypothetical protein